jgi:hypothetical protein
MLLTNSYEYKSKTNFPTKYITSSSYLLVVSLSILVFFSGEGPRGRSYGRTAALRLLVQPCDEDADDDYYFFVLFLVREHRWNDIDRGKPKYSGKKLYQCYFVHHKSHMD